MKSIRITPAYKDYLWGGTKLNSIYNKNSGFEKQQKAGSLAFILMAKALFQVENMTV